MGAGVPSAEPPVRRGFTLIELLVVIAIILVLAALLTPAVFKGLRRARQTACASQLHNFGIALLNYRTTLNDELPDWLSNLHPRYYKDLEGYICPSDGSRGEDGGKPDNLPAGLIGEQFPETNDNAGNGHPTRNTEIRACSYLYEFSGADCGWWSGYLGSGGGAALADVDKNQDGNVTWKEAKLYQMEYGDTSNSGEDYEAVRFPIVRCFHHTNEMGFTVPNDPADGGGYKREGMTQNLSFAGNVFIAPLTWELEPVE